jgi:hypothetical protein
VQPLQGILAEVHDLGTGTGNSYAHYEPSRLIAINTIAEARRVLAANLRRDDLPPAPAVIGEYVLALRDLNDYYGTMWQPERNDERDAWRAAHNLSN